jgi:hypothetical protein
VQESAATRERGQEKWASGFPSGRVTQEKFAALDFKPKS